MKEIGILGGTFDPPHIGHMIIANEVYDALNLDEVWFIPTNEPPHKDKASSSAINRLEMLQLAVEGNNDFFVNDIEMKRSGKSYSIDTIKQLKATHENAQFYFIIGADNIEYLPHWYKIDELIELVHFVGVKRTAFNTETNYPVTLVDVPLIDVSSSFIRARVEEGKTIRYWVEENVYAYIKEHQLYGNREI